jgi:hypothetical protein
MMKKSLFLMSALLTLPLFAAELTVKELTMNKPYEEKITDAETISIVDTPNVEKNAVLVLSASVLFTIPSETPLYSEVTSEKLALAVDTDGKILIADADQNDGEGGWLKTTVVTDEVAPVAVFAEGKVQEDKLVFDVKLGDAKYTVVSPSTDLQLEEIETIGEGSVSELSLAMVDTSALPGGGDSSATLEPTFVHDYMMWVTEVLKGDMPGIALPEGVNPEDAFVMNVAGKPELKIEKVDPVNGTITLVGTSTVGETTATVSLDKINGKIFISWTESLNGKVSVTEAKVNEDESTNEKFVLNWPDQKARFIKAAVSREAPVAPTSL